MKGKLASKLAEKQLKAMGVDLSNPEKLTFKTIKDLINISVPCMIKQKQMIEFLEKQIQNLKDEFGE